MKIAPAPQWGENQPCSVTIRIAQKRVTSAAKNAAAQRERKGLPADQCGKPSDFFVDGKPMCRQHAATAALAHVVEASRPRTNEEEIANPRCGCSSDDVRRVIVEHGVCTMGGCPYGGDV